MPFIILTNLSHTSEIKGKAFIDIEAALVSGSFCSSIVCVGMVSGRSKVRALVRAVIFSPRLQQLGASLEESLLELSDQNKTVCKT